MNTITLKITNFGPVNCEFTDKNMVWIHGEFNNQHLSGYVPNVFGVDEIIPGNEHTVTVLKTSVMEHMNGGRINEKEYSSIEEYIADPLVKERCIQQYKKEPFDFNFRGEPTRVDHKFYLNHNGKDISVISPGYDTVVPPEWYSEVHMTKAAELYSKYCFEDLDEAISNLGAVDDLFGTRYFPVACFNRNLLDDAKDVCENFKGFSQPLLYEDRVFFGLRMKPCEIGYITDLYDAGGVILKNCEWDW